MPLDMEVGLGPRPYCGRWGPALPTDRGTKAPTFRSMSIVAKRSPITATAELLYIKCVGYCSSVQAQILTFLSKITDDGMMTNNLNLNLNDVD